MSTRPKPKRRRKASAAAKLRPFWILIVLLLATASAAGYFFATWPALRPHGVSVYGNHVVPSSQIIAKAGVVADRNVWLQNTRAMAARIQQIPYIATASVHRRPPGTVFVDVTEREPFAVVDSEGVQVLVDRDLRVLESDTGSARTLPRFVASGAGPLEPGSFVTKAAVKSLRDDDETLIAAHIAPAALAFDRYGELVATLRSGVRLLFGDDEDLPKKIPLVNPILAKLERAGRPIAAIDLRALNTPIVVYKK